MIHFTLFRYIVKFGAMLFVCPILSQFFTISSNFGFGSEREGLKVFYSVGRLHMKDEMRWNKIRMNRKPNG
jgi:hypothetical protein